MHSVDENVGRLTDWLRARGDFDDTMLIYSSDQGFFLGDHGWFDKRFMFEESLRMPFLLSYPNRVSAGHTFDGMVTNVDMAQTILDAAGVAPGERMQGRSFWPDLVGEQADDPVEGVYYRYWENDDIIHKAPAHYGYRTERYKLDLLLQRRVLAAVHGVLPLPARVGALRPRGRPRRAPQRLRRPDHAEVREALKAAMWREQSRLGDAPHPSQPVPPGCEDVVAAKPLPRRPFSFPLIKVGAAGQEPSQDPSQDGE